MPRGRKKSHKGGHRHFSNEDDMQMEAEKLRKEQEWRKMKGIESDEDEGEQDKVADGESAAAAPRKPKAEPVTGQPGELPPSDDSDEESDDEDAEPDKPKGVAHLIEIENPNRVKAKSKKVTEVSTEDSAAAGPNLSRREREELEKQAAKERYDKMHAAGKTEEARADLARLALIRKQREEAAKKRDEERKAQEDAKTAAEKKLLDKKSAAS